MKNFKSKELTISLAALIICCAALALGVSITYKLNQVQKHWASYLSSSSEATYTLATIHNHIGYAGTIHKFKNLILRKQTDDIASLERSFTDLEQSVTEYSQYATSRGEQKALTDLYAVISSYKDNIHLANQLIEQGLAPEEIDRRIVIDDEPAINALDVLDKASIERSRAMELQTSQAMTEVIELLILGIFIIPAIIIFAAFLIIFLGKLARANRQLSDINRSMDTLFETVPDAIITANKHGRLLQANKTAVALFGYSQDELLNLRIEELMPERFRHEHLGYRTSYFDSPKKRAMENSDVLHIVTKTGAEIPVEISLSYFTEGSENIAVATIRDISVRKHQEAAIKLSQKRLAEAQRIAKLGSWSMDLTTGETIWSKEVYSILRQPKETTPSLELYLSLSCDTEMDELNEVISSLKKTQNSYNLIRKLCFGNGDTCYVREEGEVSRGPDGRVTHAVGTIRDITDSVKTREKLEQAAVVFEHTSDAVLITNTEHKIIAINHAYSRISGYSEAESLGQDAGFTKSGQHDENFYHEMRAQLEQTGSWQGEIWDRRKDGEIYPKWLSINSVRNDRGAMRYYVGVFSDISHIKSTEDKLRHLALHDSLTGLPNRLSFNDQLERALHHAKRNEQGVAVLFLDLDRFKTINDSLGHPIGDALLIEVASRLKSCLRNEDVIARLGGDEFTIIMEDILTPEDAAKVSEKIIHALSAPVDLDGHQFYITTSIGISLFPEDGGSVTELVKNADAAMYRAKESGRNRYEFYSSELADAAVERLELEGELRQAISNQEFSLYYQPQFNIQTGEITGAEALIRWHHPERGIISPDQFIPVAEETGLINQIGEIALHKACIQLSRWHKKGWNLPKVSVNVAGQQIHSGQLLGLVKEALSLANLPPTALEVELTETTLMEKTELTINTLSKLRDLGVTISIDDFGTGYSSLSYLKTLPIQRIKIDRSFVQDIPEDSNDMAITKAIIALSRNLQLDVIAEGLESEEQEVFLLAEGCVQAQGFLFSKPLPAKALFERFHDRSALGTEPGSTIKTDSPLLSN